ncbi:MAG: DUF2442 domain-containing protein [Planctomycetes bacterium]|nr:DUF2442 domain-containing protein [Planctomycetota bacterium]
MTTLVLEKDPLAVDVRLSGKDLTIQLSDGRSVAVPLTWYPRLLNASKTERRNWRLLGGGYAIEWPDLDEHIGVEGLLAGRSSGESERSLSRWLAARATPTKKGPSGSRKRK